MTPDQFRAALADLGLGRLEEFFKYRIKLAAENLVHGEWEPIIVSA